MCNLAVSDVGGGQIKETSRMDDFEIVERPVAVASIESDQRGGAELDIKLMNRI
jgi:hypothetical protein